MKEFLLKIYDAIEWFTGEYGVYLAAFCAGFLVAMLWWFVKHPEEFYTRKEDDNSDEQIEVENGK